MIWAGEVEWWLEAYAYADKRSVQLVGLVITLKSIPEYVDSYGCNVAAPLCLLTEAMIMTRGIFSALAPA